MIAEAKRKKVIEIWDSYFSSTENKLYSKAGNKFDNPLDQPRLNAIIEIKKLIAGFLNENLNIYEFKSSLDSYNKRNNLWGFTAIKGQMFFNQLVKQNEQQIAMLTSLLQKMIVAPQSLDEALNKIEEFEVFVKGQQEKAKDKRKVANPGSVGYFLTYFWQIHDPERWPIIYTSLLKALEEIELWKDQESQKDDYLFFYHLNEDIKQILHQHTKSPINNWNVEHAFWNFKGNPNTPYKSKTTTNTPTSTQTSIAVEEKLEVTLKASFDLQDYLLPKIANLIEVGKQTDKSSSAKGNEFEKLVADIFRFLDFEVDVLGQGKGRNPDAILKFREENTAFIVDAKAYGNGYSLGLDDRAIKEYINYHCPKLQKEGYKKIGFIIVSNSFRSGFDSFINDVTWNTDVKRFILLTSEALLYLFAYKMKDKLGLSFIIEKLISCGNMVEASSIIEQFDDF